MATTRDLVGNAALIKKRQETLSLQNYLFGVFELHLIWHHRGRIECEIEIPFQDRNC